MNRKPLFAMILSLALTSLSFAKDEPSDKVEKIVLTKESAKADLARTLNTLANTSQAQFEKVVPAMAKSRRAEGNAAMATAIEGLLDTENRELLQARVRALIEEESQNGLLLLVDMLSSLGNTSYHDDTLHAKSCEWASSTPLDCTAYWTFVFLTLDGVEIPQN